MGLQMVRTDAIVVPAHRQKRHKRTRIQDTKASIAEIGIVMALKLAENGDGQYELVAGEGRLIAARELGIEEVPAFIELKDEKRDFAATAAENMVREDLSPAEEAEAIKGMLDRHYTLEQVCAITGMSKQRVTARLALVEVPERIRAAFDHGGLPPSAAQPLKEIHDGNPQIAEAIVKVAECNVELIAGDLADRPGYVLSNLEHFLREAGVKGKAPFIVGLRRGQPYGRKLEWNPEDGDRIQITGKAAEWFIERSENTPSYERPALQLSDEDLDAAVAYGVAYDEPGEHGHVWIHDLAWLTAQINDVVLPRMQSESEARAAEKAKTKQADKRQSDDLRQASPLELASKLGQKFTRELKLPAQAANLDLGWALQNGLAAPELSKDVAVFFAHEVLGRANGRGSWGNDSRARRYAECAARVLQAWITVEKRTLKSGKVKETVVYLDGEAAEGRMWQYIEAAKSAEEVLGRTLVIVAAAGRFMRECGANGQTPQLQYPANEQARAALARIAGRVVPASIKRLERQKTAYDATAEAERLIAQAKSEAPAEGTEACSASSNSCGSATS